MLGQAASVSFIIVCAKCTTHAPNVKASRRTRTCWPFVTRLTCAWKNCDYPKQNKSTHRSGGCRHNRLPNKKSCIGGTSNRLLLFLLPSPVLSFRGTFHRDSKGSSSVVKMSTKREAVVEQKAVVVPDLTIKDLLSAIP